MRHSDNDLLEVWAMWHGNRSRLLGNSFPKLRRSRELSQSNGNRFGWLGTYWELLPSKIGNLGTSFCTFPSLGISTHSWSPCWLLTTFLFPCDHTYIWLTQKKFSRKLSCNKSLFCATLSSWCIDLYLTLVLEYSLIPTLNCSYH